MKILSILLTAICLCSVVASAEVKTAREIKTALTPTRGGKVEKVTAPFSEAAYKEVNPNLDPKERGIVITYESQQTIGTVNTNSSAQDTFEGIRFKKDSTELADEASRRQLIEIAQALKELKSANAYVIEGHTCDLGTDAHNQNLSERRAIAVALYFRSQGISCEFVPFGYGESKPTNNNTTEYERAKNRRVVIRLKV